MHGGFHADITTESDGRTGRRELNADNCAELTDAAVVVLSLLVRGEAALLEEPAPAEPGTPATDTPEVATAEPLPSPPPPAGLDLDAIAEEAKARPVPAKRPKAETEPEKAAPSSRPGPPLAVELRARAVGGVTAFTTGPVEVGGWLGAQASYGALGIELQTGYRSPLDNVATGETDVSLQSVDVGVFGCAVFPLRVRLATCAGPLLEVLIATAPEVAEPRFDSLVLVQAVLGVQASVPIGGRWSVAVLADGRFRTRSVHLDVAPYGRVLELPAFGASFSAGPELTF
jgi:hypothetical protein